MKSGKVILAGAGPGDLGLVTVKTISSLRAADVVVHDQLANPGLLSFAGKKAEIIFAGKYAGNHVLSQKEINRLMVVKAREGKVVVRLKGGDPFLFGRGAEEALALARAGIPFEVIPGVSSAYAVPAYAGIPLTCRGISSRLSIVTGHEAPGKKKPSIPWKQLLDDRATLVVLMGFGNLEKIINAFGRAPKTLAMPAAVIHNGTLAAQAVVTGRISDIVEKVRASGMKAPAIIVIGKIVRLRESLDWFSPGAGLWNRRVLVTRTAHQTADFRAFLEAQGARVYAVPLIRIVPSGNRKGIQKKLGELSSYSWIIFTSVNGVDLFLKNLRACRVALSSLRGNKFAAIGPKTAEALRKAGIKVSLVPGDHVQEALAEGMIKKAAAGPRPVLLVHAANSRPLLEERMRSAGIRVDTMELYRSVPVTRNHARVRSMLAQRKVDCIMLTSASCAESLAAVFPPGRIMAETRGVVIAAIGPVTADAARREGFEVAVESKVFTTAGLVSAVREYYAQQTEAQP